MFNSLKICQLIKRATYSMLQIILSREQEQGRVIEAV